MTRGYTAGAALIIAWLALSTFSSFIPQIFPGPPVIEPAPDLTIAERFRYVGMMFGPLPDWVKRWMGLQQFVFAYPPTFEGSTSAPLPGTSAALGALGSITATCYHVVPLRGPVSRPPTGIRHVEQKAVPEGKKALALGVTVAGGATINEPFKGASYKADKSRPPICKVELRYCVPDALKLSNDPALKAAADALIAAGPDAAEASSYWVLLRYHHDVVLEEAKASLRRRSRGRVFVAHRIVSSSLKDRIQADLNTARKDRNKLRTLVLSTLLSDIKNKEIDDEAEADEKRRHDELMDLKKTQYEQREQYRARVRQERADRLSGDTGEANRILQEDLEFRQEAQREIDKAKAAGRPWYMLQKAKEAKERALFPSGGSGKA